MAQPEHTEPPEWVKQLRDEPEWVKALVQRNTPPPRAGSNPGSYDAGRQDQELLTAVRAMPEQVVNALKSAIEGATAQQPTGQQQTPPPQQQAPQQQAPNATGQQQQAPPTQQQDTPPNHSETFADKWFANKLFT
jgi:hypothetical protein